MVAFTATGCSSAAAWLAADCIQITVAGRVGCVASQNMPTRLQNTSDPLTTMAAVIGQTHVSNERNGWDVYVDST
jgi:hypothetical protein